MMRKSAALVMSVVLVTNIISPGQACDRNKTDRGSYSYPFESIRPANIIEGIYDSGWGYARSAEVCSYDAECFPWRSGNGQHLFFASINFNGPPRQGHQGNENWDIYISEWNPAQQCWEEEVNIGTSINTRADGER